MQEEKSQENQSVDPNTVVMYPNIDENIPIPKSAREALPELTNEQELEMMANTIKLLSDLTGQPIQATQEDVAEAKTIAEAMIKDPNTKLQLKKYKNSTLASLAGMVAEIDASVVDNLKDLKTVVVNGLLREAMTADKAKERITALRAIGEVDGVDAFKKHTEVVHKNMSLDDIEEKLKMLVDKIQKRIEAEEPQVIDAEFTEDKHE